jgi:tetratricopeptide (TPR) repeat protein
MSVILTLIFILNSPFFVSAAGTKARIEERGKLWMVYKGAPDGVSVGMEGFLMKKTYSAQARKLVEKRIAHFKISKVFAKFSHATVDQWLENFSAKDAQWAEFVNKLAPPSGSATKKAAKSVTRVETGKDKRYYLDKGDNAYELGKFEQAMSYYEKVIEIDPDDPGAKLRNTSARGKSFLQQGDFDYNKNDYPSAYEYFIMAFQILDGDDKIIAAEKIVDIWSKDAGFFEKMKDFEISPAVILGDLFDHCDRLLKEEQLDKLAILAQKLIKYAEDDARRNKLSTLMMAKEIRNDIDAGNYLKLMELTEMSINEDNLFKASFIIGKLDKSMIDNATREKLVRLKERYDTRKTQLQISRAKKERDAKIKKLENEAKAFIALKKYDEAINRYLEMYKEEPDNIEYSKTIKDLQQKKFEHEKFQSQLKSRVEMDSLLLYAVDSFKNDLMQDALDYYVKAYKILPDEEKPVAGVIDVLEKCGPEDTKYITIPLLGRKSSKFTKDFLTLLENRHLGKDDETAFKILSRIVFIKNNKQYDELMLKVKQNLYDKYMGLAAKQFRDANFEEAAKWFTKAREMKETDDVNQWIVVCGEVSKIKTLFHQNKRKEVGQYFETLLSNSNKYDILEGMLNLSEFYMEEYDFKKSSYLYKRVGKFQFVKFNKRIGELNDKEKTLKKKAKEERKNK